MVPLTAIPRLICWKHPSFYAQWCVWNEDEPNRRVCGDSPTAAVRRFLELNSHGELYFELMSDLDLVGNGEPLCRMRWAPPDLLLDCEECHGSGVYTGLLASEPCRVCEGKGAIKVLS